LAHQGHSIDKTPSTQHVEQVQMDTIVTIGYRNQSGIRHASPTTPPFNPSPDRKRDSNKDPDGDCANDASDLDTRSGRNAASPQHTLNLTV
jgi:hypothetical protein